MKIFPAEDYPAIIRLSHRRHRNSNFDAEEMLSERIEVWSKIARDLLAAGGTIKNDVIVPFDFPLPFKFGISYFRVTVELRWRNDELRYEAVYRRAALDFIALFNKASKAVWN